MGKLFRVFFSSTFTDFQNERNALQKDVFPKLKEYCETRGARFQPIDLRWGIPDEVALQQSTTQVCLDEIRRCQEHTPKPNFLILLGERYGWTPSPAKIPKTEYDRISPYFSADGKVLVEKWYWEDENELCRVEDGTLTTVYELQPRGEQYKDYDVWGPKETKLHSILLLAAQKANLSESEMVKYYSSVTHQEIIEGAFDVEDASSHVHGFFRTLTDIPNDEMMNYKDSNPTRIQHLTQLKEQVRKRLYSTIHEYKVNFRNEHEKAAYIKEFCDDVFNSLKSTIEQELDLLEEILPLEEEIHAHIEFAKERAKVFVGREDIIQKIVDYVKDNSKIPFVIFGRPGSGKSALIAKIYDRLQKEKPNNEIFIRFIGTSTFSSDSVELLRNICAEIAKKYEIALEEDIPFDYNELIGFFGGILNEVRVEKQLILLIDALDQFSKNDKGRDLAWLPSQLPDSVKIITTYATDDIDIGNLVERKLPNSLHELHTLPSEEGSRILDILLRNSLRRLTPEQKELVLQKFKENGLPLYLKLVFEQARRWNSYDMVDPAVLAPEVNGVIKDLLERLYSEHTREIVDRILSYIAAARNGLTEDEILEVMTSDSEFFEWYTKEQIYHTLPEPRLPWIVWSRLRSDIEPYLTERGYDNTSTISFFHRQFGNYIKHEILSDEYQKVIANYFQLQDNFFGENRIPNYRKSSEVNYLLHQANMSQILTENLTNMEYIDLKCRTNQISDLLDYFHTAPDKEKIREFQRFVQKQAHIFREYAAKFPQLIGQQAVNQSESLGIAQAGEHYLSSLKIHLPWLEIKLKERDFSILTFTGHVGWVKDCAFSPDGTRILSASQDGTLKLWNADTGEEIRSFTGHTWEVNGCAFSPEGTKILSASRDGTLMLWDADSGEDVRTFTGHKKSVMTCAFSPDGTQILSGSRDTTLKLWDVENGKEIRTFTGHTGYVSRCAFSPDGTRILSASHDETLKLWDVETGEDLRTFTGHLAYVRACVFSPDGTRILSTSDDKTIKLWNADTGEEIHTFTNTTRVYWCAFSPNGTRILLTLSDTLKLWDADTGEEIRTFTGHTDSVMGCAFSPDGTHVLSASYDMTLKLWNTEIEEDARTLIWHMNFVRECAISPDETQVLSASDDRTVKLWDAVTGEELRSFTGHTDNVMGCAFSPDGTRILSASFDKTLKLWDTNTGEEIRTFTGHKHYVTGCAFSPDGTRILSASFDKALKLWDADTGEEIRTFTGHTGFLFGCAFSPDGARILSASGDHTSKLWDADTGEEIRTFTGHRNLVGSCVFSPDGTRILSTSSDMTLKLWDADTGEEIRTFLGHTGIVNRCAFSPDGTRIFSVSWDKTLRLWDVDTGENVLLAPTSGATMCVAVSKKGLVVCGDAGGSLYIFQLIEP